MWCQQTFCFEKFVENVQQCFAFTAQANSLAHYLNFHLRWWYQNQATFQNTLHQIFVFECETSNLDYLFVFIFILENFGKSEPNLTSLIFDICKGPPVIYNLAKYARYAKFSYWIKKNFAQTIFQKVLRVINCLFLWKKWDLKQYFDRREEFENLDTQAEQKW